MDIRKADMKDLDKLAEFYDIVVKHLESTVNYPRWVYNDYPSRKSVKAAIEKDMQYICTDDGEVAGAFILNDDPQGDYSMGSWSAELKDGEFSVIHTLAVRPGALRHGTGMAMVDYCIEKSRQDGYKAVRLDVVPDNYPARRLYEKAGFTFAGEADIRRMDYIPLFVLYELNF